MAVTLNDLPGRYPTCSPPRETWAELKTVQSGVLNVFTGGLQEAGIL